MPEEFCEACQGSGLLHPQQNTDAVCTVCGGTGKVVTDEPVVADLPSEEGSGQLEPPAEKKTDGLEE